ncbi:MAG: single-stranded DNA-binding protein [Muribaculaceae bacterium]|nr:single-stranded DNA-binding protein [Muribaculaceae bacterium]
MSVNKVILLGNVGRDPEVRYVAQNQPVASFSLATTEHAYTNANGVRVPERTEWHNIVVWGRNAEVAEKFIRKGTQLYVEGHLRTRTWEDRNQIKRSITEVYADTFELLGRPRSATQPQQPE